MRNHVTQYVMFIYNVSITTMLKRVLIVLSLSLPGSNLEHQPSDTDSTGDSITWVFENPGYMILCHLTGAGSQ